MGRYGFAVGLLLAIGLVTSANCAPEARVTASQAQIPPLAPGMARVWFLRGWDAPSGQKYVFGADTAVYANGATVGSLRTGTSFFRDFAPGTYTFTVQPFGLPTPQATTLQLTAGEQAYLQAQWVASWQFGYPEADFSFAPNTFAIFTKALVLASKAEQPAARAREPALSRYVAEPRCQLSVVLAAVQLPPSRSVLTEIVPRSRRARARPGDSGEKRGLRHLSPRRQPARAVPE